jgi:hypothetical protein
MTRPTPCAAAGCREPAVAAVSWNSNLAYCRRHLAEFHGQPAAAPEAPPPRPLSRRSGEWPECHGGRKR